VKYRVETLKCNFFTDVVLEKMLERWKFVLALEISSKNTDMLESQILDTGNLYSVSTY
jgi:hypothetical protein